MIRGHVNEQQKRGERRRMHDEPRKVNEISKKKNKIENINKLFACVE